MVTLPFHVFVLGIAYEVKKKQKRKKKKEESQNKKTRLEVQ